MIPKQCPKCGSEKGWHGPQYRGSVGYISPEDIDSAPAAATLADGTELISRDVMKSIASKLHQRLDYDCKTCSFNFSTPTLDS